MVEGRPRSEINPFQKVVSLPPSQSCEAMLTECEIGRTGNTGPESGEEASYAAS